ncbi:MAG: hypothetical protein U0359_05430 [Byssovorax sp.]
MRPRQLAPALLAAAMLLAPRPARADDPSSSAQPFAAERDRFMLSRNTIVTTLGVWSAASLVGGALFTLDPPWMPKVAPSRAERRGFGVMTLSFAIVNSVFAVAGALGTSSLRRSLVDRPALDHERHAGGSFFAVNAGLDMLYITAGALMFQRKTPWLRGFGMGALSQGGFLIGFDVSSAMTYRFGGR